MNTDKIIAESIAKDYAPKDNSKIVALKKLDSRAKLPAIVFAYSFGIVSSLVVGTGMWLSMQVIGNSTTSMVIGIIIGIIGFIGCGLNYPIYKKKIENPLTSDRQQYYNQHMNSYSYVLERCAMTEHHCDDFEGVKASLPDDEMLYDLAELYKIFGDTTRIKLLYILFEGEMCVQHLAELLGVSQSAVSHQLRILKSSRLVRYRREGKTIYYSLADDHVRSIIECGVEHINE